MWRRVTLRIEKVCTCIRSPKAKHVVSSALSPSSHSLAKTHSSTVPRNEDLKEWIVRPIHVRSVLSVSTAVCTGAVVASSENREVDSDNLFPSSRVMLMTGVLSVNAGIYGAFSLSDVFQTRSRRAAQLHNFMYKHFILSMDHLRYRRWHVMFTHCLTHLDFRHFLQNSLLTVGAFIALSPFVSIPLFVFGGLASGTAGIFVLKRIGKPNVCIVGSSGGLYATISYAVMSREWKHEPPFVPYALLFGELLRSSWHTVKMLKGKAGSIAFSNSHAGHLAGLIFGISAYVVCALSAKVDVPLSKEKREYVRSLPDDNA